MKKLLLAFSLVPLLCSAAQFSEQPESDWVHAPGEKVTVKLELDAPVDGVPVVTVTGIDGESRPLTDVKYIPGGKSAEFTLPTATPGYFQLRSGNTLRQSYAVIPMPDAARSTFDNPFGVNFHLTRIPLAEAKREVRMARRIGLDWGRGSLFDWSDSRDESDEVFQRFQPLIDFIAEAGMHQLHSIFFIPKYASSAPPGSEYIVYSRSVGEDLTPAEEFCRKFAARCPFIEYWEVGNEPDADLFWRGRWKNIIAGDDEAIIRDYVDFLAACSRGFKAGNPEAKILYAGLTSRGPVGHTYRPFLATSLKAGAAQYYDIMNTHYVADLDKIRAVMKSNNAPAVPIWVTEIGSSSGGHGRSERSQIVADLTQQIEQLAAGAQKVFKYDFRDDGTNPNEQEHNFGLVRRDFSPKPSYVAAATLIRLLHAAKFDRTLNLVKNSDNGYMKGFRFLNSDGRPVNVIWLNAAPAAKCKIKSDTPLTLVDAMGRERELLPVKGEIQLQLDELPVFLLGDVKDAPGAPVYPVDQLLRSIPVPLKNPEFAGMNGWQSTFDPAVAEVSTGDGAVKIIVNAPGETQFKCIFQRIDLEPYMAQLKPGEYYKLRLTARHRRGDVSGRGSTLAGILYNAEGKRFGSMEDSYRAGTHNWRDVDLAQTLPAQTRSVGVEYYVAPQTTGTFEFTAPVCELELWKH